MTDALTARWLFEQKETAERLEREKERMRQLIAIAYEAGRRSALEDLGLVLQGGRR